MNKQDAFVFGFGFGMMLALTLTGLTSLPSEFQKDGLLDRGIIEHNPKTGELQWVEAPTNKTTIKENE